MAINFKLNPVWRVKDEHDDDMGRTWAGWDATRSLQDNYENNRGLWLLGERAERERYATFSVDGIVRMVVEVDQIETIPARDPDRRPKRAIVGRVLHGAHPIHDDFVNRAVDNHRNPVTYVDDPDGQSRECACGCGVAVPRTRDFVPGHDQRAVHERIARRWGGTVEFIEWFDATYPERPSTGG
jgi:hypothetical protein